MIDVFIQVVLLVGFCAIIATVGIATELAIRIPPAVLPPAVPPAPDPYDCKK